MSRIKTVDTAKELQDTVAEAVRAAFAMQSRVMWCCCPRLAPAGTCFLLTRKGEECLSRPCITCKEGVNKLAAA